MTYDTRQVVRPARIAAGSVLTALAALSIAGCPSPVMPEQDAPKDVQLRFRSFDIGTDDCEDIFSFGDFTVQIRVTVSPGATEVFNTTRFVELGSAAFQATVQSVELDELVSFALQPDEEFEVAITVTEDDPINSVEPQPWSAVRSFDYLGVESASLNIVNGPGCFRDDRLDYQIEIAP